MSAVRLSLIMCLLSPDSHRIALQGAHPRGKAARVVLSLDIEQAENGDDAHCSERKDWKGHGAEEHPSFRPNKFGDSPKRCSRGQAGFSRPAAPNKRPQRGGSRGNLPENVSKKVRLSDSAKFAKSSFGLALH